jgi:SAM-dependent methyltransferase
MAELEHQEAWDSPYFERLRGRIRAGRYTPAGFKRGLESRADGLGPAYDALDTLFAGLLKPSVEDISVALAPEMVAYQPTPVRQVLALIDAAKIGPGDLFYDLGSGLGQVAILVALLTGARSKGIEIEPAYELSAQRSARSLGLTGIEFTRGDARQASLEGGSVYFLYSPFRGALLRQVSERLKRQAAQRPIRLCSLGPCTAELRAAGWRGSREAGADEIEVFRT